MNKRLILPVLLLAVSLGAAAWLSSAPVSKEPLTVTSFDHYSAAQGALTAENVSTAETTAAVSVSGSRFEMAGVIPGGAPYHILLNQTAAVDTGGRYTVLSVLPFEDLLRIVLLDNGGQAMHYLDLASSQTGGVRAYQLNWYRAFLEPKIEDLATSGDTSRSADRAFAATATVYGDTFREVLVLSFLSEWDDPVSAGMSYTAKTTMKLASKTTEDTRRGESAPTVWEGNSLRVTSVAYTAVTPYGEYIRKIESRAKGLSDEAGTVEYSVGSAVSSAPPFHRLSFADGGGDQTFGSVGRRLLPGCGPAPAPHGRSARLFRRRPGTGAWGQHGFRFL